MARLVDLTRPCENCRKRHATVTLLDKNETSVGVYCRNCGVEKLHVLQKKERLDSDRRVNVKTA